MGALALNEWQRGLIEARQQTLTAQGELLVKVLGDEEITRGDPQPALDPFKAAELLIDNFIPEGQRARLFDIDGLLVADSYAVTEVIPGQPLPPALPAGTPPPMPDADSLSRDATNWTAPAAPSRPRSNRRWTVNRRRPCGYRKAATGWCPSLSRCGMCNRSWAC